MRYAVAIGGECTVHEDTEIPSYGTLRLTLENHVIDLLETDPTVALYWTDDDGTFERYDAGPANRWATLDEVPPFVCQALGLPTLPLREQWENELGKAQTEIAANLDEFILTDPYLETY